MRLRLYLFLSLLSLWNAAPRQGFAADTDYSQYVAPTWPNMLRTMVRFNALSLNDTMLMDEYTIVTDCDIYQAFHSDDFKWDQVKQAVLQSVQMNLPTFPQRYYYDTTLQLDRYDFQAKIYRLTSKSAITNVNTFLLFDVKGDNCNGTELNVIPRTFRAVLDNAFYFDGLPLSEQDAQSLFKQMQKDNNNDKYIFARFYVRVVYVEPLRKVTVLNGNHETETSYKQTNNAIAGSVRMDARLDGVAFFTDDERTHMVYRIQP